MTWLFFICIKVMKKNVRSTKCKQYLTLRVAWINHRKNFAFTNHSRQNTLNKVNN